jgi:hypothetical protein
VEEDFSASYRIATQAELIHAQHKLMLKYSIKEGIDLDLDKLRFKFREISQIGIVVKDLQKTMENYWKMLGIGPWSVYTFAPPALKEPMIRGKSIPYSMRLAIAQIGLMQLELIQPLEGPSIYKEFLAAKGEGLHHILTRIENIDETLLDFKKMGIDVLMSGKFYGGEFYYLDTEPILGIIFELAKPRTRERALPSPEKKYPTS